MHILLIEDNPFLRGVFKEILERFGHQVYAAAHGAEGLALLRESQQAVDLVINDLVMPQMNALELYDALQELQASVRMLVVTNYPMPQTAASLVERPGVRWLNKPVSMEQFDEVLREMAVH
jgi:CheY-like chemotaxis protein